jgi:hypothetical protein
MRLLVVASEKRERLMSERIQNVRVEHLETDEVRSYVGCQQKRVRPEMDEPYLKGDQYTFIALGDGRSTDQFIEKVRHATSADRLFDVSADAFAPYEKAIDRGLFDRANHAQIVKLFSHPVERGPRAVQPPSFVSVAKGCRNRDAPRGPRDHVARRAEERVAAPVVQTTDATDLRVLEEVGPSPRGTGAALAYYNFCRVHRSLRVTPAMEAKMTTSVWTLRDLLRG